MNTEAVEKSIVNTKNDKLLSNFLGVFAADMINQDFNLKEFMKRDNPCVILNTDSQDKSGAHWIGMLITDDDLLFVFDSYGHFGFKTFFKKKSSLVKSIFKNTGQKSLYMYSNPLLTMKAIKGHVKDDVNDKVDAERKIQIASFNFDYSKILDDEKVLNNKTTTDLMKTFIILLKKFGCKSSKAMRKKNCLNFAYLLDPVQQYNWDTYYCGVYTIQFLDNIYKKEIISRNSIENVLNQLYVEVDMTKDNEEMIEEYAKENDIVIEPF